MRRWLLLLWLMLLVEAFVVAPPELPSTPGMLLRMLTFSWEGISPTLVALFWSVGILWALYASFLLTEDRVTRPHQFWAVGASLFLGSFALLPYFALRRHGPHHATTPRAMLEHPVLRMSLFAALISVFLFGVLAGNLNMFWYEFETRKLAHVMLLDFISMGALLPFLAADKL